MTKQARGPLLPLLGGQDDDTAGPLYRRLYARLRRVILDGTLAPGHRLPSTRTLAAELRCSRVTVEAAIAQLQAEGLVMRRVGAGTFVTAVRPPAGRAPSAARRRSAEQRAAVGAPTLARRGQRTADAALDPEPAQARALVPCMPALDAFPYALWHRVLARRSRRVGATLLGYGEAAGYRPLRAAIADYLVTARGVRCTWEQVLVVTSAQQALALAAQLLLDPGDAVWHEEPGYRHARAALHAAGARIVPVPVDAEGLDVAAGIAAAPDARLAYVTPSHQYPLGVTLTLRRRLALLAWARAAGAWVVEDDYDSEFRYTGRPLAAIQGLEPDGTSSRVLYVGTFNKVMFPSLRLAYLVVPPALVDAFAGARALADGHTAVLPQAVMSDFLTEGHFLAHLRAMRALYRERRDVLLTHVAAEMDGRLRLGPADTGMHVTAWLPAGTNDAAVVAQAADRGVELRALSAYYAAQHSPPGLVLGYSGAPVPALQGAVRMLATLFGAGAF